MYLHIRWISTFTIVCVVDGLYGRFHFFFRWLCQIPPAANPIKADKVCLAQSRDAASSELAKITNVATNIVMITNAETVCRVRTLNRSSCAFQLSGLSEPGVKTSSSLDCCPISTCSLIVLGVLSLLLMTILPSNYSNEVDKFTLTALVFFVFPSANMKAFIPCLTSG